MPSWDVVEKGGGWGGQSFQRGSQGQERCVCGKHLATPKRRQLHELFQALNVAEGGEKS